MIILIYIVDVLILSYLYQLNNKSIILGALINMLLIPIYGANIFVQWGFLETNSTNLCFAAVFFAMSLLAYNSCYEKMKHHLDTLFISYLMFLFLSSAIALYSNIEPRTTLQLNILGASFLAFYLSNSVNAFILNNKKIKNKVVRKITANTVGQFVDSLVFFGVVFNNTRNSIPLILGGFVIKSALNILDTPLYFWTLKRMGRRKE